MILAPELLQTLERLANIFAAMNIRYALGGAVAMSFHGYVRATRDLDVLVLVPATRAQEFADTLTDAGFRMHDDEGRSIAVDVERMLVSQRERGHFAVWWKLVRAEVFSPVVPLQDAVLTRTILVSLEDFDVCVTTAEDLILLKMVFHRDKDLVDVRRLLAANVSSLDFDYIEDWIPRTLEPNVGEELRQMIRLARSRG